MPSFSRRFVLQSAARGAAGVTLGMLGLRGISANAQEPIATSELGAGAHVLTVGGTNVVAVVDAAGAALVDGGSAAQSSRFLELVAGLPGSPRVHTLFNTHWHPQQTGSNVALARAGATIVAQENTKLWLTTDVTWPWSGETVDPLPEEALPSRSFFSSDELTVGETLAGCGHLRDCPHTDGDMYVFFPQQNVLAVGGAVTGAGWPSIDWWTGGWIGGIVGAIDMLFAVANEDTRIVPAHGPVLRRADLQSQYDMYSVIWERLVKTLYGGGGPKEALAAEPTKEFNDIMGEADEFVVRAFESLWPYLSPDA